MKIWKELSDNITPWYEREVGPLSSARESVNGDVLILGTSDAVPERYFLGNDVETITIVEPDYLPNMKYMVLRYLEWVRLVTDGSPKSRLPFTR